MYPMRRLTASGSRDTSIPPTSAEPAVGRNIPHNMRIVVDLPAPFAPRKPKISPGCTSNDSRSTAVNAPNLRVSSLTSMAAMSAPQGAVETCVGETDVGQRARAIELRLEQGQLRVEDVR